MKGKRENVCVLHKGAPRACQPLFWRRRTDQSGQDEGNSGTVEAGQGAGVGFACCVWGLMRKMVGPRGAGKEGWSGAGESWMARLHGSLQETSSPGLSQDCGVGRAL